MVAALIIACFVGAGWFMGGPLGSGIGFFVGVAVASGSK